MLSLAFLACLLGLRQPQPDVAASAPPDVWAARGCIDDARGTWFRDAKFGAIIHFGPYSHLGGFHEGKQVVPSEQIIGLGERRARLPDYRTKVAGAFNPAKFDAAAWVSMMKKAGQKYVILTTKHHDGFCMFGTATTGFNIMEASPFKRDVVKELAEECKRQGLVFGVYYSIGDWSAKDVQKPGYASYADYMKAQLRELLTSYGEIKLLWFDNWWYVDDQWSNDEAHAKDLYRFARSVAPNVLVNDRCGAGVKSDHGDYATPENQLKGSLQSRYFEVVMTNTEDENWGWVRGAANYRAPKVLIRNLIDSVSKGGNFVLNVGPTAEGEFPPEHVKILEAIGGWTGPHAEAVYATVPAPEVGPPVEKDGVAYATKSRDGRFVYIHVVEWPANGAALHVPFTGRAVIGIGQMATETGLRMEAGHVSMRDGATTVILPPPEKKNPYATVYKLWIAPPE